MSFGSDRAAGGPSPEIAQRPEPLRLGGGQRPSPGALARARAGDERVELPGLVLHDRRLFRNEVLLLAGVPRQVVELGRRGLDVFPGAVDEAPQLRPSVILPRIDGLDIGGEVGRLPSPDVGQERGPSHSGGTDIPRRSRMVGMMSMRRTRAGTTSPAGRPLPNG